MLPTLFLRKCAHNASSDPFAAKHKVDTETGQAVAPWPATKGSILRSTNYAVHTCSLTFTICPTLLWNTSSKSAVDWDKLLVPLDFGKEVVPSLSRLEVP